jgi:peptidoglycan/xylan/chitin deacetylase (PgdA/CDA1 family)
VGSDPWNLAVSPRNFRDQMRLLADEGSCIPLSDLVRGIRSKSLRPGSVCITFDDGYSDNLVNAKPILQEFALPATFFLTSGYLDGTKGFWWDALERPFFREERIPPKLALAIERGWLAFDFAGDTEYRAAAFAGHRQWRAWDPPPSQRHLAYHQLWQVLHRLPSSTRDRVLAAIEAWAGGNASDAAATNRPLSLQQVRQLASGPGIEIGGHSVTHSSLALLDRDAQYREILDNKQHLEDLLGGSLHHFSYPHGEFSEETVSLLEQAGYDSACTTQNVGIEHPADRFRLPRISVDDWNEEEFARRLARRFAGD